MREREARARRDAAIKQQRAAVRAGAAAAGVAVGARAHPRAGGRAGGANAASSGPPARGVTMDLAVRLRRDQPLPPWCFLCMQHTDPGTRCPYPGGKYSSFLSTPSHLTLSYLSGSDDICLNTTYRRRHSPVSGPGLKSFRLVRPVCLPFVPYRQRDKGEYKV